MDKAVEKLREMEFEVKPQKSIAEMEKEELRGLIKTLATAVLTSREHIEAMKKELATISAEYDEKAKEARRLERRVKQLEGELDADKPIDIPWEFGPREEAGLLEVE